VVRRNVPLVEQIVLEILAALDGGQLAQPTGVLPSEADLSQLYGVSRATVREALGKLESAGVVIRRHGIGTFVNPFIVKNSAGVQDWFEEAHGFVDALRSLGGNPEVKLLRVLVERAGQLSAGLQLSPEDLVIIVEKVVSSDGEPLIHSINAIPLALLPPDSRDRATQLASECESTFRFLEVHCNTRVHHQQSQIRASLVGPELAALVSCLPTDACLEVEEIAYSIDLQPLFHGLNHFRGDRVSFRQIRRPAINLTVTQPDQSAPALDHLRR
jgi:GntR family transcriptional regulator